MLKSLLRLSTLSLMDLNLSNVYFNIVFVVKLVYLLFLEQSECFFFTSIPEHVLIYIVW